MANDSAGRYPSITVSALTTVGLYLCKLTGWPKIK